MIIDLNCDMGEGMSHDEAIMPFISSASIASGFHAGDETTIRKTITLCLKHGVAIGAHPGFNDKTNFGRTPIQLSEGELYQTVLKQLEIMQKACDERGATLLYVKPHGAMYNMAATNSKMSATIVKAVKYFNADLIFYGLSGSHMITEAQALGLKTASEAFADRTYQPNGTLTSRSRQDALIKDVNIALHQVMQMVTSKTVTTTNGKTIPINAETICIHGDGPHAVEFARTIHTNLKKNNVVIKSPAL